MVEVLAQITKDRSLNIASKGFDFGHNIPKQRIHPLIKPNLEGSFIIAEIKRTSPSAGNISAIPKVEKLASDYLNGGAGAISVLCEESHFNGSLLDLMQVKNAYPKVCILRKDFIQYPEEIDISYRAGADMVLLIVAMFIQEETGFERFSTLYQKCLSYGLTPLVEVHTKEEIDFIAPLKPSLVGINSRNLHDFRVDIPKACSLISLLPKETKVIFESGIHSAHSAFMIASIGFDGLLCGSYLVSSENPTKTLQSLKCAFSLAYKNKPPFFRIVFNKLNTYSRPLLKICGITNLDDAFLIAKEQTAQGIDMLGFILVENSPRYIESKRIKEIAKALQKLYPDILRIGVVNDKNSLQQAKILYEQGHLHAIQLHGLNPKTPHIFANISLKDALFCFYGVQNLTQTQDFNPHYIGAFCLVDSKSPQGGGSGKSIQKEVLLSLNESYLCIAGGINEQNIQDFLELKPSMLDINSGIESIPGKKDISKLKTLLEKLNSICQDS